MGSTVTRRTFWLGCTGALCLPAVAAAPDLLAQIGAQLEQHAVVRAKFVQTRQMVALKRPVVSRGRMVFSRRDGVVWLVEGPLKVGYWLSEQRVVEVTADGVRREQNMSDNPAMAQVGRLMRAMLGAQVEALREPFEIKAQGALNQWDIELMPRQTQLAQYIKALRISGGRYIDTLRIEERSGDVTTIRFADSLSSNETTPAELAAFAGTH